MKRIAADSLWGRKLAAAKGSREADNSRIPHDVLERNRAVDDARAADLAARKARRAEKAKA